MKAFLFTVSFVVCISYSFCAPSLVLTNTPQNFDNELKEKEDSDNKTLIIPIIYEFNVYSNISNRFATTLVTSKVKNAETIAKEATFTVILPEKAFISEFVMEIKGQSYKAYVKEKEEAKKIYDAAVQRGQSAGHVAVSARDSNKFTVSVNVEPESKATFLLTYEELLERKNSQYELILNIHPGQIVKDMNIQVFINESRPLKFVKTPALRTGNEISKNDELLKPSSYINIINSTSAILKFKPTIDDQKRFIKGLGGKENEGLSGQFVVQYDVERDQDGGEVLLRDGYFVHFLAPDDLEPLPKHIVFVLDTSGSMYGDKIKQLREAMLSILDQLKDTDLVHIIDFNTDVYVWNIETGKRISVKINNDQDPFEELLKIELPPPVPATKEFITKGKKVIEQLKDEEMTNIMSAISTALHVIRQNQKRNSESKKTHQPLIMFLTDGDPTVGIDIPDDIINVTSRLNIGLSKVPIFSLSFGDGADKNFLRKLSLNNLGFSRHIYEAADASLQLEGFYQQISSPLLSNTSRLNIGLSKVPIFSLSFGDGADKNFLRKLSLNNLGFSRHIYEAADASLQLEGFYQQISSPLLSNVHFKYDSAVKDVSQINFPIIFKGSEVVVAGKYEGVDIDCIIVGFGINGTTSLKPLIKTPVSSLERLWAYLTIKQKLEQTETVGNSSQLKKQAIDLALKYSFVTDVTSLVVVKPNDTSAVDTTDASKVNQELEQVSSFASHGVRMPSRYDAFIPVSQFDDEDMEESIVDLVVVNITIQDVNWRNKLPWLNSSVSVNGTLNIAGENYLLQDENSVLPTTDCPSTPLNATEHGVCAPLYACFQIFSLLTNLQTYEQYFCPFEKTYAGVCCPRQYVPIA